MNYIEKVKEIRASQNLTQDDFAEKIGVSKAKINQFEAGNTKMSFELLESLVKHCGVDANEFMGMPKPFEINEDGEDTINFHCFDLACTGIEIMKDAGILSSENTNYARRGLYKFFNKLDKLPKNKQLNEVMHSLVKVCTLK